MKATNGVVVIGLSLAMLLQSTAEAQQSSNLSPVEHELQILGTQTGEIVELLKELVFQRTEEQKLKRLQVAVLALQLRSTAIGEIEARIRLLEDRAAAANEELAQLDAESQRIDTIAGSESTPEAEREHLSSMKTMFESQIDMIKERIWLIESQIVDLQNELASKRRDVDVLEEIVMEGLSDL
jgi:chromosome segregation ATPase